MKIGEILWLKQPILIFLKMAAAAAILDLVKPHFCRFPSIINHVTNYLSKFDIGQFIGSKVVAIWNYFA